MAQWEEGANCLLSHCWRPCFYSSTVVLLPQLSWTIWAHGLELANLWQRQLCSVHAGWFHPSQPNPSKCPEKNRTFPVMGTNTSLLCSEQWRDVWALSCSAAEQFGHLLCCHKARNLDTASINERANKPGTFNCSCFLPQGICSYLRNWEVQTQKLECYFMLPLDLII